MVLLEEQARWYCKCCKHETTKKSLTVCSSCNQPYGKNGRKSASIDNQQLHVKQWQEENAGYEKRQILESPQGPASDSSSSGEKVEPVLGEPPILLRSNSESSPRSSVSSNEQGHFSLMARKKWSEISTDMMKKDSHATSKSTEWFHPDTGKLAGTATDDMDDTPLSEMTPAKKNHREGLKKYPNYVSGQLSMTTTTENHIGYGFNEELVLNATVQSGSCSDSDTTVPPHDLARVARPRKKMVCIRKNGKSSKIQKKEPFTSPNQERSKDL